MTAIFVILFVIAIVTLFLSVLKISDKKLKVLCVILCAVVAVGCVFFIIADALNSGNDKIEGSDTQTTEDVSDNAQDTDEKSTDVQSADETSADGETGSTGDSEMAPIAESLIGNDLKVAADLIEISPVELEDNSSYVYTCDGKMYDTLTDGQKKCYDDMAAKLVAYEELRSAADDYGIATEEELGDTVFALIKDNPVFECYSDIQTGVEESGKIVVYANYFVPGDVTHTAVYDMQGVKNKMEIFEEECKLIVSSVPHNASLYDTYRYFALVLSSHTDVSNSEKATSDIYSALNGKEVTAQAFAKAFEYICKTADISCSLVNGSIDGVGRIWNIVRLECGYYYIDSALCDSSCETVGDAAWYKYFMVNEEQISATHKADVPCELTGEAIEAPVK